MARGGYRAGSGRPKGSPKKEREKKEKKCVATEAKKTPMSPLEYMLAVMNSDNADENRRDKMAIAAAPYVHERAVDKKLGKKEQKIVDAKNAENVFSIRRSKPKIEIDNS